MEHKIHTLSKTIINQISAGEVVERPANMVKELLENALDAGADQIEIRFDQGGSFMQVIDNGQGIQSEDLPLALAPHSTSKIQVASDLWKINSYGFRGEALASIAEVSDLLVISKPASQTEAAQLKSNFGKIDRVEKTGAIKGTTVVVKNLFQNIPARRKFLKSEVSETMLIKNMIKAIALSRSDVAFKVFHKNKLLFYWGKQKSLKDRVQDVLSLKDSFDVSLVQQPISLSAVLCPPNVVAQNRRQMWFFVNKRWVENSTLYSAVLTAYRGLLMHGEYPIAVVHLSCPPEDLDVNVHPKKAEVRFSHPSTIFKCVHHSIRTALEKAPWLKETQNTLDVPPQKSYSSSFNPSSHRHHSASFPPMRFSSSPAASPPLTESVLKELTPNVVQGKALPSDSFSFKSSYWSSLHVLSQAHLTYILTQSSTAIILIDQHAAHERVLYEELMLRWNKKPSVVQNRLLPLSFNLDESLIEALLEVQADLLKLGIQLERSGPEQICVLSAPPILKDKALQTALSQMATELKSEGGSAAIENIIAHVCAGLACHSAIRAGQVLQLEQMQELLKQMDQFPLSSFCPHGRPVSVTYPLSQIEKAFGRRK